MSADYLSLVKGILGPGPRRFADERAWERLEGTLGFSLPEDYKSIVDDYAPVRINDSFLLEHPATEAWNLGKGIARTAEVASAVPWDEEDDLECDPRLVLGIPEMRFATADGLTPVGGTVHMQTVFLAPGAPPERWRIMTHYEGDFAEYRMSFSEWFYRWLTGEDTFGGASEEPMVPAVLRLLPPRLGEPPVVVYGPGE